MKSLFPVILTVLALQGDDPLEARTKGRGDAPVTVYEMADFQCPACRMFTVTVLPTIEREFVQTGKVRWVFINLPLTSIHPNAVAAAEVAMCAARQGGSRFWQTHDALYQHQDDWAKLA
ncbi:MAG TPA: thioredoxin domain-containing protein, partial [Gemmatimonadales bacterium]|nr:thioredoxin domain-containing protein [Gemmatimonadales bacterium]